MDSTVIRRGLRGFLTAVIPFWCMVPIFLVFGFLFWATIEARLPWNVLFGALAFLLVGLMCRFGQVIREQCRLGGGDAAG